VYLRRGNGCQVLARLPLDAAQGQPEARRWGSAIALTTVPVLLPLRLFLVVARDFVPLEKAKPCQQYTSQRGDYRPGQQAALLVVEA
jgi:hypothetical protein